MKRIVILSVVLALAGIIGVAWHGFVPEPVIRFVGFQTQEQNGRALFRIENRSRFPFAYLGLSAEIPRYAYRLPTPSGWHVVDFPTCSAPRTIPARSSVDVHVPSPAQPGPFQIGIVFKRGTAAEYYQPNPSNRLRDLLWLWRLGLIRTPGKTPHSTWSSTTGGESHRAAGELPETRSAGR